MRREPEDPAVWVVVAMLVQKDVFLDLETRRLIETAGRDRTWVAGVGSQKRAPPHLLQKPRRAPGDERYHRECARTHSSRSETAQAV